MSSRWILRLGDSSVPDRALIGGKAWSIARMIELGLPVPPAFVITTRACAAYLSVGDFPNGLEAEVASGIAWLEQKTGRTFGCGPSPLLVSVRSGAAISMPGMMDTVLNTGINAATEAALATETGDAAFAHDVHRRYYDLYASIVLKLASVGFESEGNPDTWNAALEATSGQRVPVDATACLHAAIRAVFESWNTRRARRYRKHNNISDDLGTAVTIQSMVFGNLSATSGTGVLFTRNPITGENVPYGEYLPHAQGEDVVSGRFTPQSLESMRETVPAALEKLLIVGAAVERAHHDVQDIEFTVQNGDLFVLQSRAAKRAPQAAIRFAVELAQEGLIDEATALERVTPEQLRSVLAPRLTDEQAATASVVAEGQPSCPGVGIGVVVTNADEAERRAAAGEAVVLARATTSPEDVPSMLNAKAVITEQGGSTSHAAVVSRALGVACVTGCGPGSVVRLAGQVVTVDATRGKIFGGVVEPISPDPSADAQVAALRKMIEGYAPIEVVASAQTATGPIVNLDALTNAKDPGDVALLLANATTATGQALDTDVGMRAAIDAGIDTIVGTPALPLLLRAARVALSRRTAS